MTSASGPDRAEQPPRRRSIVGTALLSTGAFFAALVAVCALVNRPVPLSAVPGVGPKYRYLAEHKDDFDIVFLGSSRVFHHFLPGLFDADVKAATGRTLNSFNFGYDAMWPPESFYMLKQVLALRSKRVRWVFIDLMQIHPEIDTQNSTTLRIAYWHDWPHTLMAWRTMAETPRWTGAKFSLALEHGRHLLSRWTNLGRGSEWLSALLQPREARRQAPMKWESRGGFEVGGDKVMAGRELEEFETSVARLRKSLPPAKLKPVFREAVAKMAAAVRAAGAEPVFVLAPTLDSRENVTELPGIAPVISFADPNRFPALYEPANHYDGWHLNEQGATVFTHLLAEQFSALLQARGTTDQNHE